MTGKGKMCLPDVLWAAKGTTTCRLQDIRIHLDGDVTSPLQEDAQKWRRDFETVVALVLLSCCVLLVEEASVTRVW